MSWSIISSSKFFNQFTFGYISCTATNSDSVEDLDTNFCLVDLENIRFSGIFPLDRSALTGALFSLLGPSARMSGGKSRVIGRSVSFAGLWGAILLIPPCEAAR